MRMGRRLTRSRNAILGGVAAGVADWIGADPALVRIVWALLVPLTGGAALLAYIVAWVVVPEEPWRPTAPAVADAGTAGMATSGATGDAPAPEPEPAPRPIDEGRAGLLIGAGLVVVGLWLLAREYLPRLEWNLVWPIVLVGIGVVILVSSARRR
jgi:phage shock protein C